MLYDGDIVIFILTCPKKEKENKFVFSRTILTMACLGMITFINGRHYDEEMEDVLYMIVSFYVQIVSFF